MIRITTNSGDIFLQPMSCNLTMSINGVWVIKMEHPYDREGRWKYIAEDKVMKIDISALDGVSTVQRYRIQLCQRTLNTIYVEAYPIALDAFNNKVFTSIRAAGATASGLANLITSEDYPVTTNIDDTVTSDCEYTNTNLIAIINGGDDCFIEKYGGEVRYDNNEIAINTRLDSGTTAYLYTGRDVSSVAHTVNTSDVVTRIYPISANGIRLNGSGYVDSPLLAEYGVPHSEFINTNYMLCTEDEKNPDIEAFNLTASYKSQLITLLEPKMQTQLEVRETWGDYKRNVEYLQDTMKRTKAKDKWRGLIEKLQDEFSSQVNNVAFKQMIRDWVKQSLAFIDDIDAGRDEYKIIKIDLGVETKYIYAEGTAAAHGEPVKSEWVRIDNKWRWFNSEGYLVQAKDDSHNWSWFSRNGYKYYGYKASNASDDIRVSNQWLKINGEWYWFKGGSGDEKGTHDKPKSVANAINNYFLAILNTYIDPSTGDVGDLRYEIGRWEQNLYTRLYARMRSYCNRLYSEGIDKPKLEIDLEAMDISQIEGYQQLHTLSLGNNVEFRNNGTKIEERIVELDYDCIRNTNTKIVLGAPTETISAIITRNISQGQNLVAGYGVSLDGNVINIADGGGQIQGGLRWWEETTSHIERTVTSVPLGGWTCDDAYLIQVPKQWHLDHEGNVYNFSHDGSKAVGAWMHFRYTNAHYMGTVIMSTDRDAVKYICEGLEEPFNTTIEYGGLTWYVGGGNGRDIDTGEATSMSSVSDYGNVEDIIYSGDLPHLTHYYDKFYDACLALFEVANVRTRNSFITGMNVGENYPFYGGYVASGSMTPENAPFRVDKNGNVVGKEFTAGAHRLTNKQDKLTAGDNIQIANNTISATDTTYSAGDNIQIDANNEISATDTTYEDFAGGAHGLVPPVQTQAGKFLKDDGTWGEAGGGSSDLDAIELTKAQYDALTPAEKADADKIYFLSDYDSEDEVVVVHTTDYVESEYDECYLDKTYSEIQSAINDGKAVRIINSISGSFPVEYALSMTTSNELIFQDISGTRIYDQDVSNWLFKTRRAMVYSSSPSIARFIDYEAGVAKNSSS